MNTSKEMRLYLLFNFLASLLTRSVRFTSTGLFFYYYYCSFLNYRFDEIYTTFIISQFFLLFFLLHHFSCELIDFEYFVDALRLNFFFSINEKFDADFDFTQFSFIHLKQIEDFLLCVHPIHFAIESIQIRCQTRTQQSIPLDLCMCVWISYQNRIEFRFECLALIILGQDHSRLVKVSPSTRIDVFELNYFIGHHENWIWSASEDLAAVALIFFSISYFFDEQ